MSKPIEIKGKRNIDKLFNNDTPALRSSSIANKVDEEWLQHYVQVNIINRLYLNIDFKDSELIVSDLKKKYLDTSLKIKKKTSTIKLYL